MCKKEKKIEKVKKRERKEKKREKIEKEMDETSILLEYTLYVNVPLSISAMLSANFFLVMNIHMQSSYVHETIPKKLWQII